MGSHPARLLQRPTKWTGALTPVRENVWSGWSSPMGRSRPNIVYVRNDHESSPGPSADPVRPRPAGRPCGGHPAGPARHGPGAVRRQRLPGHPHRGDRAAGRADPGRALPPLPRQGGSVPGGLRGGRRRGGPVPPAPLGGSTAPTPGRSSGPTARSISTRPPPTRPTGRSSWSTVPPSSGGTTCRRRSDGPTSKIASTWPTPSRRGCSNPSRWSPWPICWPPSAWVRPCTWPTPRIPTPARRQISECNERLLAGLAARGPSGPTMPDGPRVLPTPSPSPSPSPHRLRHRLHRLLHHTATL